MICQEYFKERSVVLVRLGVGRGLKVQISTLPQGASSFSKWFSLTFGGFEG